MTRKQKKNEKKSLWMLSTGPDKSEKWSILLLLLFFDFFFDKGVAQMKNRMYICIL